MQGKSRPWPTGKHTFALCKVFEHLSTFSFQETGGKGEGANPDLEEVQPQPLDITMPTDSCVKTVTYFVLLPIVFPLWLTLPDTRKQSGEFQTGLTFHFSGWGARGGGGSTFRPFMAWHLSRAHYIRCLFANHYPPMAYPARHQKDVMWVKRQMLCQKKIRAATDGSCT